MNAPAGPRHGNWTSRLRWFGAEFFVIVTGILVALAVNAWWNTLEEADREATYLSQLRADLLETETLVDEADSVMGPVDAAGARLVRSFFEEGRPSEDSITAWFARASRIRDVRPVMGTVEALIATGDLKVIQSDSLRSAITAYLDDSRKTLSIHDQERVRWVEVLLRFRGRLNPAKLDETAAGEAPAASPLRTLPAGSRRDPFPLGVGALLTDREAYNEVRQLHAHKATLRTMRSWMRRDSQALRGMVEAELALRDMR